MWMANNGKQGSVRAVSKLNLTKPLKIGASGKPRSKGEVFGTIAQHVGIHRRDVAAAFHVMGSIIKADLSKSGSGIFKVPGFLRITGEREAATQERPGGNPLPKEPTLF